MTTADEFLEKKTQYCSKLQARITPEQCEYNRKRANSDGLFYADKMPGVSLKHCRGCPGLNGHEEKKNMTTDEIRADQRECNMCGETKSLEDYFRPFKGLEGQASAPRVKTCIKCERRFGWCPEKYKTKDLDEPINGPSITHQRKDSPTKENGDNQELTNEEPRLTLDEWEEITNTGKKIEEESPPTSKKQSPTNDPLADAKLVHGMLQRTSTPVVRVDNQCRYLHIPKQTIMRFPVIDSSSHMDLYVDSHGHPLILLHRSPGPSSRKIQRDQQIRSGGLKVSCKLYAEALGWEGGKRWVVESTSRSDVIKLVSAEK